MPLHSDFDKLHSALMDTILLIFPNRDLPLIGTHRHNPCDGILARPGVVSEHLDRFLTRETARIPDDTHTLRNVWVHHGFEGHPFDGSVAARLIASATRDAA